MERPRRPEKPYPEFPLFAHPSGKWCKKINGKIYYFGTWMNIVNGLPNIPYSYEDSAMRALAEYDLFRSVKEAKETLDKLCNVLKHYVLNWCIADQHLNTAPGLVYALTTSNQEVLYVGSTSKTLRGRWITDSHRLLPMIKQQGVCLRYTHLAFDGSTMSDCRSRLRMEQLLILGLDPPINKSYIANSGRYNADSV